MDGAGEEAAEDEVPLPKNIRDETIYPEPLLSKEQVKSGGFILYIAGKKVLRTRRADLSDV